MRRWVLAFVPAAALVAAAVAIGAQTAGTAVSREPVSKLLVVSLPGLSWADVEAHAPPNLTAFVSEAAIGDISTRIGRTRASSTDAYLSFGAGTRSIAPEIDQAVALDPDETYGGVRSAEILERRLGEVPEGIAYLAVGAALDLNERSSFGGQPGLLGDLLAAAGVRRAVIANADAAEGFVSDEPPPDGAYARGAATALMGSDGIVPEGTVGRGLLVDDASAPFGRRLNPDEVLQAFDEVWGLEGPAVVLLEGSDLARASGYAPRATPGQARELRAEAVRASDHLLGELLSRVDASADAVLVVSPVSRGGQPELGVVALRTPDVHGGVLRSATTRRDGYVQLADLAPTVLHLMGIDEPTEIEGRMFQVTHRPRAGRVGELAAEARAAGFRDSLMPVVVPVIIGGLLVLAVAALGNRRVGRGRWPIAPAALFALGVVPGTFVAGQLASVTDRLALYGLAVLVVGAALATATTTVDRRWAGLGPLVAVGLIVAMFSIDVVLGAPLQVNSVFGYSVAVAGRFAGIGNLAFALFGSATIVLGSLVAERYGRAGLPVVAGLFTAVVLLEGLPMLGADVGGVISMVPAFGLTFMLLRGRRPRPVDFAMLVAGAGAAVLAFAFIDSTRGAANQTHLARLADHLVNGRISAFADSLNRRFEASFGDAELAGRMVVVGLMVLVTGYVVAHSRGWIERYGVSWSRVEASPRAAGAVGLAVLASLGLVANDSSIAVPATMLIIIAPAAVLAWRPRTEPSA